jgi:hypothetical protein
MSGLRAVPLTLREAHVFVDAHHRHHDAPQGGRFAIGAARGEDVVGVVIVGRPVARGNDDGWTAEVTRLCTLPDTRNACSFLYAAAWRACRAMGFRRLITYILDTEPGTTLRAAGWTLIGERGGGSWSCTSRPRVDTHPLQGKLLWERSA